MSKETFSDLVITLFITINVFLLLSSRTYGVQCSNHVRHFNSVLVSQQSLSYEELVIGGNETCTFEDSEYNVMGNITVKDNATLVIKNESG